MPTVIFTEHDGTEHKVSTDAGTSLMEAAIDNLVPGIDGDCGGNCACATCHIFVDSKWAALLSAPDETEETMLELAEGVTAHSRLACQIKLSEELDGIKVVMPEAQH